MNTNLAQILYDSPIEFKVDKKNRKYMFIKFRPKFHKDEFFIRDSYKSCKPEIYGGIVYDTKNGFIVKQILCRKIKTKTNKEILRYNIVPLLIIRKTKAKKLNCINIDYDQSFTNKNRKFHNIKVDKHLALICTNRLFRETVHFNIVMENTRVLVLDLLKSKIKELIKNGQLQIDNQQK